MLPMTDVEALLPQFKDDELLAMVRGERVDIDALVALKQLTLRRSPRLGEAASLALYDRRRSARLRLTAVQALRELPNAVAEPALLSALRPEDPQVTSEAVYALGAMGHKAALAALEQLGHGGSTRLATALTFARTLLSHRLRLDSHPAAVPNAAPRLELDPSQSRAIEVDFPVVDAARLALMQARVPGLSLSSRVSARLRCAGNELELVLVEPFDRVEGLDQLFTHCGLPLVMFNSGDTPERPYLAEYFLSRPEKGARSANVLGVRPKGSAGYVGKLERHGDRVRFQLEAIPSLHSAALAIEGEYDARSQALTFTRAESHARVDRKFVPRRQPKPAPRG